MSESTQKGPILVVIGTRPEAVKLAPVVQELRRRGGREVVGVFYRWLGGEELVDAFLRSGGRCVSKVRRTARG